MLRSKNRILTTHTGSLPRPAALTALYVRRSRGEAIDAAELDRVGKAAVHEVVAKQIAAGIDVGNNGEQQREAFFLYVRHRMSGFGGGWTRRVFADVDALSGIHGMEGGARRGATSRSATWAASPRRSARSATWTARRSRPNARISAPRSTQHGGGFAEPFMTAPSPGIIAAAMRNAWYDTEDAYLAALGRALQVEYETIVRHGFVLQIDAPDLAMERHISYQDRPLGEFVGFVERVVATINDALVNVPRERVRLHACWGNYEGPHDCDVALPEMLPTIRQAKVGGFVLPFANPRHAHEYRCPEGPAARRRPGHRRRRDRSADQFRRASRGRWPTGSSMSRARSAIRRRVLAGTDCGFDTSAGRGRVADDVVWAKLAAMAEGARIATQRLF